MSSVLVKESVVFRCPPRMKKELAGAAELYETNVSDIIRLCIRESLPVLRKRFNGEEDISGADNPNI